MGAIQRKSLYKVLVTENKGKGWLFGKGDYHNTVVEYVIADDEKQARSVAIKSLKNAGLLDDVKKIIGVCVECEHSRVVLGV